MEELQQGFETVSRRYVLECASNWGRGMIPALQQAAAALLPGTPNAKGLTLALLGQADWWTLGGVSCAEWTGVRMADVLAEVRERALNRSNRSPPTLTRHPS